MKEFSDSDATVGLAQPPLHKSLGGTDTESVRTEDFVNKFSQLVQETTPSEKGVGVGGAPRGRGSALDAESIRTEDFAREFRKTLIPPTAASVGAKHLSTAPLARPTAYRPLTSSAIWRGAPGGSVEAESVTLAGEDRRLLAPRSLRPPVVAFDDSYLGGGGEGAGSTAGSSIRAQVLRERISSLLRVPPSGVNLDSADRRLQDLLQGRQIRPVGGGSSRNSSPPRVASLVTSRQLSPTRLAALNRASSAGRISPIRETPSRSPPADDPNEEDLLLGDDEFANEVRYQSRLIQRELELERRRRMVGGSIGGGGGGGGLTSRDRSRERSLSPARTPRESLDKKVLELDELNQQVRKTLQEKEKIIGELHFVQDCLRRQQAEVRLTEKLCRDNKSRAEDTKTELMLAEMKRDSTAKELEQLSDDLTQKKEQLRRMEETCRTRMKELQDFESIGVAKEEIENILAERDELYQLVRQNEDAEFQRYELERKLTQTREEMQSQASMAQQKVIALEEELEASLTKIAETSEERNMLKLRLVDLEDKMKLLGANLDEITDANRQLARAKEVAERERIEEVERLKMRMQGDLSHIQRRTEEEEAAYKRQIQQLKENLDTLQREVEHREEVNCNYRDQLMRLENQLALATEAKSHMSQEMERQLERAGADAERRLEVARDESRRDADDRLARERSAWQAESAKELRAVQDRLKRAAAQLEQELQCRDEELRAAQEIVRSKEAALKSAEEEHKTELREQLRATLRTEKEKWDRESSERLQKELSAVKADAGRVIEGLQGESQKRGDAVKEYEGELNKQAAELEREREKFRALQRDRAAAINHLKEVAREETVKEVQMVREQLEAAAAAELDRLRGQLRFTEEALAALKAEFDDTVKRESDLSSTMERIERAVINQANAECLRIAEVLGVTPRRVTPGGQLEQQSGGQLSHRSLSYPGHPITAALANLEACGEELLAYTGELRDDSQKLKERLAREVKDHEDESARQRLDFEQEKAAELQSLRERIIQDHMQEITKLAKAQSDSLDAAVKEKEAEVRELRAGMQKWKSETAERLAARLQDEFRREFDKKIRELRNSIRSKDQELVNFKKEIEALEQERLGVFKPQPQQLGQQQQQQAAAAAIPEPKALFQLQERVKALREENMALRKQSTLARSPSLRGGLQASADSPRFAHQHHQQQQQQPHQSLMTSSLTNLHQAGKELPASTAAAAAAAGTENYVHHLESNLRALEDRVRRAERQNELIGKDRINSANQQQREMKLQQLQQLHGLGQLGSARASSRGVGGGGGGGVGGGGSFRAPSSSGQVSGR